MVNSVAVCSAPPVRRRRYVLIEGRSVGTTQVRTTLMRAVDSMVGPPAGVAGTLGGGVEMLSVSLQLSAQPYSLYALKLYTWVCDGPTSTSVKTVSSMVAHWLLLAQTVFSAASISRTTRLTGDPWSFGRTHKMRMSTVSVVFVVHRSTWMGAAITFGMCFVWNGRYKLHTPDGVAGWELHA
jgi:hypothetical protein